MSTAAHTTTRSSRHDNQIAPRSHSSRHDPTARATTPRRALRHPARATIPQLAPRRRSSRHDSAAHATAPEPLFQRVEQIYPRSRPSRRKSRHMILQTEKIERNAITSYTKKTHVNIYPPYPPKPKPTFHNRTSTMHHQMKSAIQSTHA
jgi:hypothetical protein